MEWARPYERFRQPVETRADPAPLFPPTLGCYPGALYDPVAALKAEVALQPGASTSECPACTANVRAQWCTAAVPPCGSFDTNVVGALLPAISQAAAVRARGVDPAVAVAAVLPGLLQRVALTLPCRRFCQVHTRSACCPFPLWRDDPAPSPIHGGHFFIQPWQHQVENILSASPLLHAPHQAVIASCACGQAATFGAVWGRMSGAGGAAPLPGLPPLPPLPVALLGPLLNRPVCELYADEAAPGFTGACPAAPPNASCGTGFCVGDVPLYAQAQLLQGLAQGLASLASVSTGGRGGEGLRALGIESLARGRGEQ